MDTAKLTSHIEAFEAQANKLEESLNEIPEGQLDPDGKTKTHERVTAQIQGIRDGIARDKAQLAYAEARQEIEPSIEELAQQQAAAQIRQNEIDALASKLVEQATQKT